MDEPGAVIDGKYVLGEVVGSGGMATVWRAFQYGSQVPVAIKRIKESIAHDIGFVELFVEEARVYTQLIHPNIVQILDFGEDHQGNYFLVMEWVDGLTLAQYLAAMHELDLWPPWQLVAAVAIEALKGLHAAHMRIDPQGRLAPVFHRDVTPQNILLSRAGAVKLTDFGLARAMDRARITEPNVIKGKVGYLAPEMTEAAPASPQTDMYALGVVIWQGLTGLRMFEGKDEVEIFMSAKRADVMPLAEIRPDVPVGMSAFIDRALAFDPADRFESADQMQRVLANILYSQDVHVGPEVLGHSVIEICSYRDSGRVSR